MTIIPKKLSLAAMLLCCAFPITIHAQINKCIDSEGKTSYQAQPCPETSKSAKVTFQNASSIFVFPGNVSLADAKKMIVASCLSSAQRQGNASLRKFAAENPEKYTSFCECAANTAFADTSKITELLARKNSRAEFEKLGVQAGYACADRLQP